MGYTTLARLTLSKEQIDDLPKEYRKLIIKKLGIGTVYKRAQFIREQDIFSNSNNGWYTARVEGKALKEENTGAYLMIHKTLEVK